MLIRRLYCVCFTYVKASSHDLLKTGKCMESNFTAMVHINWEKKQLSISKITKLQTVKRFASQELQSLQETRQMATYEQNVAQKCLRMLFTAAGFSSTARSSVQNCRFNSKSPKLLYQLSDVAKSFAESCSKYLKPFCRCHPPPSCCIPDILCSRPGTLHSSLGEAYD